MAIFDFSLFQNSPHDGVNRKKKLMFQNFIQKNQKFREKIQKNGKNIGGCYKMHAFF
jgi:hypothetical protein